MTISRARNASARDLHQLPLGQAQVRDQAPRVDAVPQSFEQLLRPAVDLAPPHPTTAGRVTAQEDVFRRAQLRRQRQFLVYEGYAQRLRLARSPQPHGLALPQHLPRIRGHDATDHVHKGRFAGAILPHQRMHFRRAHVEVHSIEHSDAAEPLRNAPQFQKLLQIVFRITCLECDPFGVK
jgi:hypothetical protein